MNVIVEYSDFASPFMAEVIKNNPKWIASSLKSAGWKVSREIKKGMRSRAPGGQPYAPAHLTNKQRAALEKVLGGKVKRYYRPMGNLINAIGYDKTNAAAGVVTVGWLSKSSVYLGSKQQEGFQTPVTPAVRRAFAAAGIKLSVQKKELEAPSRPTFSPMESMLERIAKDQFESKILSYVSGNSSRGTAASGRVYKVYGR